MPKIHWKKTELNVNRPKQRRKYNLPQIKIPHIPLNIGRIIITVLFSVILIAIFSLVLKTKFVIENIEIYGANELDEGEIVDRLEWVKERNYFTVNTKEIEYQLHQDTIFLKDIYVEKKIPNRLNIYVVERFPEKVIINYTGAYLVDSENVVIDKLAESSGLDFKEEEFDIYNGLVTSNNKYIEEKMKEGLSEEELKEFKFEEIDQIEKDRLYRQISNNIAVAINQTFEENLKLTNTTQYANLDKIFRNNNITYNQGDEVEPIYIDFTEDVISYFREKEEFTANKFSWLDDFTLEVSTEESKLFIFSRRPERSLFEQTRDLDRTLFEIAKEDISFTRIDLSYKTISIK